MMRELSARVLRHQVLATVTRVLPQPQQWTNFIMMQQAVITGLDLRRARFAS